MAFQSTVTRTQLAYGVVGEPAFDGPERVGPFALDSASAANNVVGRAFTVKSEGIAQAGGSGVFAGILINPKSYANRNAIGSTNTVTLDNGTVVECMTMGYVWVLLPGAAAIGDYVVYNTTTGVLSTVTDPATPGAGNALVPNARVDKFTVTGAGLACIRLTN